MKSSLVLTIGLLFIGGLFSSCYKLKATVAVINVVDENNVAIDNARVILYGTGTMGTVEVEDTLFTNASGEAIFNLDYMYKPGQAGVAVLDINVSKAGITAQGIIKVEQEETTRETVRL